MTTQEENELICENLLGWKRLTHNDVTWWEVPSVAGEFQPSAFAAPSFTTWADAGLILEAFEIKRELIDIALEENDWLVEVGIDGHAGRDTNGPKAIRAAALAYIRSLP